MRTNIMQRTKYLILTAIIFYSASLVFGSTAQASNTVTYIENHSTHNVTFLVTPEGAGSADFSYCSAGTAHLGWCTLSPGANVQLRINFSYIDAQDQNFNIRFYVDDNQNNELQYTISARGQHFTHGPGNQCSTVTGSSPVISVSTSPQFYTVGKDCITTITNK